MGRYTWIKLYAELLHDPKMGRMQDYLWRRAVELFLLAGETGTTGQLPSVEEMAWTLHLEPSKLLQNLKSLAEVGVAHETEPGKWVVTHFESRQASLSDSERQQRYRAGLAKPQQNPRKNKQDSNDTSQKSHKLVTEVEEEVEEDSTTATTTAKSAKSENVFQFFSANFGALTPHIADTLKDFEDTYSAEWTLAALEEAVASEARNVKYAGAILKRWKTDGFQSQKNKPASKPLPTRGPGKQSTADAIDELAAWAAQKEQDVYSA